METIAPPPLNLSAPLLVACGANSKQIGKYVPILNELMPYYDINTHLRVSHFLAQCLHESDRFQAVREYASGEAYEGRRDLGNVVPGDGPRFKGRGIFQLTGRANYTAFANRFKIDCVNHPELLEQPRWAVASALHYWNSRKINALVDKDYPEPEEPGDMSVAEQRLREVTRRINGGYNGLNDRRMLTNRCLQILAPVFVDTKK